MEKSFWDKRWNESQIGFHQNTINPSLEKYVLPLLEQLPQDQSVLCPLAGKSKDIEWLASHHHTYAVEFNEKASIEFKDETSLKLIEQCENQGDFNLNRFDNLDYYCMDFFNFNPERPIALVFDRAAIVALNPQLRKIYAQKMNELLHSGSKIIMLCFEYDQQKADGPPFNVDQQEVSKLYENFKIELLESSDQEIKSPKFKEAGLSRFCQKTYLLEKM